MVEGGLADVGLITTVFEMSKLEMFNFTLWIPFTTSDIEMMLNSYIKTVNHFPDFDKNLGRSNRNSWVVPTGLRRPMN